MADPFPIYPILVLYLMMNGRHQILPEGGECWTNYYYVVGLLLHLPLALAYRRKEIENG